MKKGFAWYHWVERMLERTAIKNPETLRRQCLKNLIQAYQSLKTDRIAVKFNLKTSSSIWITVIVFSCDWFLVTVLTEEMFTLKTRVNHQYKLHTLTKEETSLVRHWPRDPTISHKKQKDNIIFTYKKTALWT